jgi:type I restriction enzyme M protein
MHWIAPSEKDAANDTLEKRLWGAADQLRANSGLTSQQYSLPVLGLIFLRFAEVRFSARRAVLEKAGGSGRRASRIDDPTAYHAEGVIYLSAKARFATLLNLPEGADVGKAVNDAMADIEKQNPQLAGVLPRTYQVFTSTLLKELLKKVSEIPATLAYDAFGRVYEYFLGEFAMTEGQQGGEFYTPSSIVRLLVEILEPYHGRILDPACGSGGMFVQSARFVAEHRKSPATELSIAGQEKVAATVNLCRMNLAVHGLEGDIRQAITYYEDLHQSTGRFDFVLANPPFNVDAVDKERLAAEVGPGRRYPFGLPRTDNANYLWIQLFYSALNAKGRAGFVMANSAADARSSEQEIRKKLIQANVVDVVVAVGPNMFYTVTLPCTLWFFDKGKKGRARPPGAPSGDSVLFIDARHIYRQIDRAHRDWTPAQIGFLGNLVRLYRGEELDFTLGGDEAKAKLAEVFGRDEPPARPQAVGRAGPPGQPKSSKEAARPAVAPYRDVPGLCKAATLAEIEAQGWSLNPGRYVGVAPGEEVSDEDFKEQLEAQNEELETLNAQARTLEKTIARNVAEILEA